MDTELFELCKEVYKRLSWDEKNTYLCYEWDVNGYRTGEKASEHASLIEMEDAEKHIIHPLYTSDYLLEKLPEEIDGKMLVLTNGDRPHAGYAERDDYGNCTLGSKFYEGASYSNTTLKALLKLTIALGDAGELAVGEKT